MKRFLTVVLLLSAGAAFAQVNPPAGGRGARTSTPARPAGAAPTAAYKDLRFPELRPVSPPHVESVTLSNGIQVFLLEDHELPLINGTVMVRAGSEFDPADKAGLAALTAQVLLDGGTVVRPEEGLVGRLQKVGADMNGVVSESFVSISFSTMKENGPEVLDALKDTLASPVFSQERIDFMKVRARNAIARRNDDAAAIAHREVLRGLFGKSSPYAAQQEYTTIDRISRADIVNFHRRYFFPKNVILSLAGDFDTAAMKNRLDTLFDDWKPASSPLPVPAAATAAADPGRYLAVKKDGGAGYIVVAGLAGSSFIQEYPAIQILSEILGGGAHGRLYRKLNSAASALTVGLTPGVDHPGIFQVSGPVNPFLTGAILRAIYGEMNDLRTKEVTDAELKSAKDAVLNSFVFTFDNQLSMLPRLTLNAFLNLPTDYIQKQQAMLAAVTKADVLNVAKAYLDPARMTTVVVANPTAFESPLESLGGPTIPVDLTIPPPKPEAAVGDLASQRKAKELLARAQQAAGGVDALLQMKDYVQESTFHLEGSATGPESTSTERWISPGYLRLDNVSTGGKVSVYCDGKTGWVASGDTSNALSGVSLEQVQSDLFHVLAPLLLSDRTPGRKLNALDDTTVEIGDAQGHLVKLVLDPATGLVNRVLWDAPTATGQVSVIATYSDYRNVSGLQVPFKEDITVNGQKYEEITVKKFQINTGLKLQDLEKRS